MAEHKEEKANLPALEDILLLGVTGQVGDDQVGQRQALAANNLTVDTLGISGAVGRSIVAGTIDENLHKQEMERRIRSP